MSNIKDDLKKLVEDTVIPEVEAYVEDLHKLLENGTQTEDDMNAIKEMESFLVELHNIIEVIKEDSLPNSEYERIYNKMLEMIEDSQNTHE